MANWYCTREALKRELSISDDLEDAVLDAVIEATSRRIEEHCGHWFYPRLETRTYSAERRDRLLLDADLLGVTALLTDEDGDRDYETIWSSTDYDLLPLNAPLGPIPGPYWEIAVSPLGTRSFPCWPAAVRIEGSWGYYDQRRALATTLGASLSASATTLTLSATGEVEVGHTLLVDQEQLFVRELVGKTATVERGMNGTTAVAHANGAALQVYEYPLVGRAATYQAAHLFRLKDAPGGFIGSPEIGTLRIAPRLHPFVVGLLDPLRRRVVG